MSKKSFEERLQAALANTKTLPCPKGAEEVADGETKLGVIPPGLQAVHALSGEIAKEHNSVIKAGVDKQAHVHASRLRTQQSVLKDLFWCLLREHFDTDAQIVGYRKNWEAVSFQSPESLESSMDEMVAEMMGGESIMVVKISGRRPRGPFGLF